MKRVLISSCMASLLFGCSSMYPPKDKSAQNRISEELKQAAKPQEKTQEKAAGAVLPQSVSSSLLPPLRGGTPKASSRQLEQRFDLVVTDAPINQVLMAIVSDTRYSILLSPKTIPPGPAGGAPGQPGAQPTAASLPGSGTSRATERLTVNLKDVTVFEALDAVREMYGYEYTVDGTRIYVQPPELKTSLYQVNYVLGQRRGVSDMQVIGGASSSGSSSGSSGSTSGTSSSGTSGGSYASIQASALSSISKSDVWGEMEDALRTVLGCQIASSVPTRGGAGAGGVGGVGGVGGAVGGAVGGGKSVV